MALRSRHLVHGSLALAIVAGLAVAGGLYVTQPKPASGEAPAAAAPAAVPVTVETLEPVRTRVWSSFSGRLHAVESAELRPQVGGRIVEVLFEDGQQVEAGEILFVIDPRPYEAAVARAEASVASAEADLAFARTDFKRAATLVEKKAVARRFYDERQSAAEVAEAALQTARAELDQARLDLEYAHVRAPISGRAGRVEVTVGNLVQPGPGAPLLTTIVASDAIYADFEVDEQTYLASIRGHAAARDAERRIPVELSLGEGGGAEAETYRGTIHSFDNRIDSGSGTIRARARFDNADGRLLPGMFATVRLADAVEREALLLPERALGFDQSKKYVLVVDREDKVAYREVALGRQVGARRIVLSGVEPGERVIVGGLQHVRPEMTVVAQEAEPAAGGVQAAAAD